MTRKFSFPAAALILGAALTISGCGRGSEAQFTESDEQTADEIAEQEAYDAAYDAAADSTSNPNGGDPFANGN